MKKFTAFVRDGEVGVIHTNFIYEEGNRYCSLEIGDPLFRKYPDFAGIFLARNVVDTKEQALHNLYEEYTKYTQDAVDKVSSLEKIRHKIANAYMDESCKN